MYSNKVKTEDTCKRVNNDTNTSACWIFLKCNVMEFCIKTSYKGAPPKRIFLKITNSPAAPAHKTELQNKSSRYRLKRLLFVERYSHVLLLHKSISNSPIYHNS